MTAPLTFWSRTAANTDDECRRARYWQTVYLGRGLSPAAKPLYFTLGDILARAHSSVRTGQLEAALAASIAEGEAYKAARQASLDAGADNMTADLRGAELACLAGGLLTGFYRHVWPLVLEEYDVVGCEPELVWDHAPGLRFGCRPDVILRRKRDDLYVVPDDKSTADISPSWFQQWETDVQLMAQAKVVEKALKLPVRSVMVFGHYKGYVARETGEQMSSLVYGWQMPGLNAPQYAGRRPKAWAGWRSFRVWEDMGYQQWVDLMPREDLLANFPMTRPIAVRDDLVDAWFRQRALREREIARASDLLQMLDKREANYPDALEMIQLARKGVLDEAFPQNFKKCKPRRGPACAYADACWLPHVASAPLESGLYVSRDPHHSTEGRPWEET